MANKQTQENVYLDDRDAWVNGAFGGEWASEVLSLPESESNTEHCSANRRVDLPERANAGRLFWWILERSGRRYGFPVVCYGEPPTTDHDHCEWGECDRGRRLVAGGLADSAPWFGKPGVVHKPFFTNILR